MTKFLALLSAFVIITRIFAHEIHFQQSDVTLTVPIVDSNRHVYSKFPIIKLDVVDTSANVTRNFSLQKSYNFFRFNETSGELWLKDGDVMMGKKFLYSHLTVMSSDEVDTFETNLRINLVAYENINDFCEKSMCFYDTVDFFVLEDFGDAFKSREIGEIAPRFYRRLCRNYYAEYSLLNASGILAINSKNNKFITAAPLDREKRSDLSVKVSCQVKSLSSPSFSFRAEKLFNFTLVDLNDNAIRVQNERVTNITRESQYFKQDDKLDYHAIFIDNDTLHANEAIEIEMLNDRLSVFNKDCKRFEKTHTKEQPSTVFYCTLRFSRNGHFTSSPYCVTLRATEALRRKVHNEDATLCVYPHFEKLPTPAPLRTSEERGGRKGKKIAENVETLSSPGDGGAEIQKMIDIKYASEMEVLRNASDFARVTQPSSEINDTKILFSIVEDPTGVFNITPNGGIVFVQQNETLKSTLSARYTLTISWKFEQLNQTQETLVIVRVVDAEFNCSASVSEEPFCSIYEIQSECERSCGLGSKNGRCKWRPHKPENSNSNYSYVYNTCVPDTETCADRYCDQLEGLAKGEMKHVCSQDCMKAEVLGVPGPKKAIGKIHSSHMCACGEISCHCGPGFSIAKTTVVPPTSTTEMILKSQSVIDSGYAGFRTSSDCGVVCVMIMIGSPSLLVFTIVALVTMRRRYVKKVKKRMMLNGSTVRYRGSNDTEIININILNEVTKENYLQTYQKFDFDAKWEFERAKLILDTTLGEGEFGKVMKAYATEIDESDSVKTVAVKTVKSGNNSVELLALLSEFQLLQEVSHPNVIKLLGACIKSEPPLIIIEYCCFGSLRSYLRLSRKLEESGDLNIDGVEPVTAKDVLSFLWQICKGMAYLADIKLVHRDLAARNVLLAEGKVCKISDFGLTRDVYEDDAYLKKSKDRVPVKWMSPESLADHVYTTKTDVWSFGIVGWEVVTLGATPYPGIPPQNLYHLLRSGYRMERPENCSPEIYILLEACWHDDPSHRPSFKSLASKFESLLGKCAKYLDIDVSGDGAVSNPLYLSNVDEDLQSQKTEETDLDYKRIDTLWSVPKFKSDISKVDNKKYLLKYDDQVQLLLARYDKPKPVHDGSSSKVLRYQNDFHTFLRPNRYVNTSQPDLLSLHDDDRERLVSESRYDTPSLRRMRSYIEMRNIARVRHSSNSTTNESFDDNNNEMPCANKRTTINENLNFNDLDKLLRADKEISFKFSSLNNLNERLTETKC